MKGPTVVQLEKMPWRRKTRRYASVGGELLAVLIDSCGSETTEDPNGEVLRILGTQVLRGDQHLQWLPPEVGTMIDMEILAWADAHHGGGIRRQYRELTELQWDGQTFWMTTFP